MMSGRTRANSLGYAIEEIAKTIYDQTMTLHYAGTHNNISAPMVQLSKKIASLAPGRLSKTFYVSGGSEAVESAIKLAKQYQMEGGNKPRAYKVISRWNAYHGTTMGAQAATDWNNLRHIAEPGVPGYSHIPAPRNYRNELGMEEEAYEALCATMLEREILHQGPDLVAAFIAEPIMQANGVHIPTKGYLERVREICTKYGVLWINDEVICGFGRTGEWFGIQHFGLQPDIMTMAKAMTAGFMPMGGVITTPEIAGGLSIYRHVHTYSGHAVASACALNVIDIKERGGLVEIAKENGAYFADALKVALGDHPIVGQTRGLGMWHAIDFTADKKTKAAFTDDTVPAIVRRMKKHGVLVNPSGTSIEIAPPLTVTRSDLDQTVEVAARSITEIAKERHLI
jgi:adenosylmethionine-8-amino-7-oxononanoate aminotransferase